MKINIPKKCINCKFLKILSSYKSLKVVWMCGIYDRAITDLIYPDEYEHKQKPEWCKATHLLICKKTPNGKKK